MARIFALACVTAATATIGCGANVVFDGTQGGGGSGDGGRGGDPTTIDTTVTTEDTTSTSTVTTTGVGGGGPGLVEEVVHEDVSEADLTIDVVPGTLGITAIAESPSDFSELRMTRLTAPSGSAVVDGIIPSNQYEYIWYGALAAATPQIGHPETFPLAMGPWTFHFSNNTPTDIAFWRRSTVDGVFHGGVLDVNVFLPEFVADEEYILDMLALAYTNWGGIELGDVRFFPLEDGYRRVDDENLFQLLAETRVAQTRPSLNVMVTESIEGSLEGAAGFSVGVPGAAVMHGSNASAVVWMIQHDSFFDPIILRHEGGHFGGLFHTSEFEPGLGDPLEDTPMCSDVLTLYENCPDFGFIMFPSGGSGENVFSQQESAVLQASNLYRGVYAPGEAPMVPYGPPLPDDQAQDSKRASPEQIERAKDRAASQVARSTAPHGLWANDLSTSVTHHLTGIGCPSPGSSYYEELDRLGSIPASVLIDVATDISAPPIVRRRALGALARLDSLDEATVDRLEILARDTVEGDVIRAAALTTLGVADYRRAGEIADDLVDDASVHVRRVAAGL